MFTRLGTAPVVGLDGGRDRAEFLHARAQFDERRDEGVFSRGRGQLRDEDCSCDMNYRRADVSLEQTENNLFKDHSSIPHAPSSGRGS